MKDLIAVTETVTDSLATQNDYARFVNEWIAYAKNHASLRSAQSERAYRNSIKQLYLFFNEQGKSILSATEADISAWLAALKKSKADSTVQAYFVAVRLFFGFLCKKKIIAENPCAEGGVPMKAGVKVERDKHKRDYLSIEQVKEMLAAMPAYTEMELRDRAVVALMVTAGLRCCEVQQAQYEDWRMVGDSQVLYIRGKGHTTKEDYVKVEPTTSKMIREYLAVRFGKRRIKDKDYLFTSTSRNHTADADDELSTQAVRAIVKRAMERIGLNDSRHTAHSLRHTACTLALRAGEKLDSVKQMMRHKNIQTTLIYSHAIEREENNCELTVGKMIFG